jgi:hypothetical protein
LSYTRCLKIKQRRDNCLLGYDAALSDINLRTSQRDVLPLSSEYNILK